MINTEVFVDPLDEASFLDVMAIIGAAQNENARLRRRVRRLRKKNARLKKRLRKAEGR